jgi:colanic acid/amylovoran biosynthesis glycosyltransferase
VARFVEKKGVDMTIRALRRLRAPAAGAVLTLIGDGPLREELESLVRQEGLERRVRFLGWKSHDETQELLLNSHLIVQPSRTASDGDTEGGAPYVLLEAQASGLCLVASRHADIPSIALPEAWFDFEEGDLDGLVTALESAIDAEGQWARRGAAARAHVRARHDAASLVSGLESFYHSLCVHNGDPLADPAPTTAGTSTRGDGVAERRADVSKRSIT